jgi:hypothetical protein
MHDFICTSDHELGGQRVAVQNSGYQAAGDNGEGIFEDFTALSEAERTNWLCQTRWSFATNRADLL